jgi:hypothetical protein
VCSVSTYCKSLLLLCIEFEELLKTEHVEKEITKKIKNYNKKKKKKFSVENFLNNPPLFFTLNNVPCFLLCFVLIFCSTFFSLFSCASFA